MLKKEIPARGMSTFWDKQPVCTDATFLDSADLEIVTSPIAFTFEKQLQRNNFAFADIKDISTDDIYNFLLKHNDLGEVTHTLLDKKCIEELRSSKDTIWTILVAKGESPDATPVHIIGFLICRIFDVKIPNSNSGTGNSVVKKVANYSYLCIETSQRGKKLAAVVIQKAMYEATSKGIFIAYQQNEINKGISKNLIKFKHWFRPLDYEFCKAADCVPLKGSRKDFRKDFRVHPYKFVTCTIGDTPETKQQICQRIQFLWDEAALKSGENTNVPLQMTFESFKDFYALSCYMLLEFSKNDAILGYCVVRKWPQYFRNIKKVVMVPLVEMFCAPAFCVHNLLAQFEDEYPFVYFNQLGQITEEMMHEVKAFPTGSSYLNWVNWKGIYAAEDIHLPLF